MYLGHDTYCLQTTRLSALLSSPVSHLCYCLSCCVPCLPLFPSQTISVSIRCAVSLVMLITSLNQFCDGYRTKRVLHPACYTRCTFVAKCIATEITTPFQYLPSSHYICHILRVLPLKYFVIVAVPFLTIILPIQISNKKSICTHRLG